MTTISHKNLTGTQLHENKGVSAATDNTVATASSGATVWQKLTNAHLTVLGNPFGSSLLHVQDQKSSGTQGDSIASGAWRTRTLNTSITNEITSASLVSNQISLPAGTYMLEGRAISYANFSCQLRIRNITDSTTLLTGLTGYSPSTQDVTNSLLMVSGRFTLSGTKVLELQHQAQITSTNGGGRAASFGTEVYADIKIWKIA